MAVDLGVRVPPAVTREIRRFGIIVNLLSIFIDIAPLLLVVLSNNWKRVSKFFSLESFTVSATLNFLLLCHVLFVIENKEQHRDVLFVSVVGFVTATVFAVLLLVHRVVMEKSYSYLGRLLMVLVLLLFHAGSLVVLCGIFADYQTTGYLINGLGSFVVLISNGITLYPVLSRKGFPDDDTKHYTLIMSIMNSADAFFFVIYAVCLGSFGFLSAICLVNATCGGILFLALTVPALLKGLLKGLLKVEEWCEACAASCGGFFRFMGFIFSYIFSLHED